MPRFDLLVRGGVVIDGTGAARRHADVGVQGDRIAEIGMLDDATADVVLDAQGRVVAPGFIDAHTHDDRLMLSSPDMAPKVSQGVTTVVAGNCGVSLAPVPGGMRLPVTPPLDLLDEAGGWFRFPTFAAYVAELGARPPATNAVLLVGHFESEVIVCDSFAKSIRAGLANRGWTNEVLVSEAQSSPISTP